MTDVTSVCNIPTPSHRRPAGERWIGGTRARLGAAAELVAPSGCVTGSARYLFLIRPDGDDGGGVGQVKCDAIGSADSMSIREMHITYFLTDDRRRAL